MPNEPRALPVRESWHASRCISRTSAAFLCFTQTLQENVMFFGLRRGLGGLAGGTNVRIGRDSLMKATLKFPDSKT